MKLVKSLAVFVVILMAGIGVFYYRETSACRNPISYDIGDFNTEFNISRDKFLNTIKEAETIWEHGTGKNLFNYKPGGKLKINLIYDERQATTVQGNLSKEQIEASRATYDSLLSQYKALELTYKSHLSSYNLEVAQFDQRLQVYNERVAQINKKGGATPGEYQELEQERKYLEKLKTELEKDLVELNAEASELNSLGDQVNQMAVKLNIKVDIHNDRYGEAREFDQGDYINNRINIYQFEGISDLRLVLAHEMGHAINLEHVENPESLMYYLMDKQNLNNPALTREDKEAFIANCKFSILRLQELFN